MKSEKVSRIVNAFQQNRYVNAVSATLVSLLPIIVVGSIGSILNALPISAYQAFLVSSGLKSLISIPNELTNNIFSLYVVFLLAYKIAESFDLDGTMVGLLSLMSFLIVTPFIVSDAGVMTALDISWFGALGLFSAFIIAILVARIYVLFIQKECFPLRNHLWQPRQEIQCPENDYRRYCHLHRRLCRCLLHFIGLADFRPWGIDRICSRGHPGPEPFLLCPDCA